MAEVKPIVSIHTNRHPNLSMPPPKDFYNPYDWDELRRKFLGKPVRDEDLNSEMLAKSTGRMIQAIRKDTGYAYSAAEIEFFAVRDLWEKMFRSDGGDK